MRTLSDLRSTVSVWNGMVQRVEDNLLLLEMAAEEEDEDTADAVAKDVEKITAELERREFLLALSGRHDRSGAILSIHAGAGGTEAQDWAEMLLRMYLRWAEQHGHTVELTDRTDGEEAGVKSATLEIRGGVGLWLSELGAGCPPAGAHQPLRFLFPSPYLLRAGGGPPLAG